MNIITIFFITLLELLHFGISTMFTITVFNLRSNKESNIWISQGVSIYGIINFKQLC